jgi:NADH-quinone oxidoreductase subunit L
MGGLRRHMPVTFAAMGTGVLAIAGIPPFAGFFSKDEILAAVAQASTPLYLLAMLTAGLTAFYMARLFFVVFYGEANTTDHPHESGPVMLIALVVLGGLSVVGGWLPHVYHFGDWVRFGPAQHEGIDWTIAAASTGLSLLAMTLAWLIYGAKTISAATLAQRLGPLYALSYNKFYIDELYLWLNRTLVDGAARLLYWIDINVIDGIVNGSAAAACWLGAKLRLAQTGQVQHYALVFFAAVVVLVVATALSGHGLAAAVATLGGVR